MINVKKALKICDKQKLREEYIKILPSDYSKEQLEANGDALLIFVENALKVKIKYNRKKNVVLNVPCVYIEDGVEHVSIDSSVVHKGSFDKFDASDFVIDVKREDLYSKTVDELKDFINNNPRTISAKEKGEWAFPETYAYEFCDLNEILGYLIPDSLIKEYGLEWNLAGILFEATWFGYDVVESEKEKKIKIDELNESIKEVKSGKAETVPWETVKKDLEEKYGLKDERTPEEKAEDERLFKLETALSIVDKYRTLSIVVEELKSL